MYTLKSVAEVYIENYGLIVMKCRRYYESKTHLCKCAGITIDDLVSEAYFAVEKAVEAYDESKGYKIQTYFSYQFMYRFNQLIGNNPLNESLSLESTTLQSEECMLINTIPDEESQTPFERVENSDYYDQLNSDIKTALSNLTEDESFVVNSYYLQNKSIKDIADSMKVTTQKTRTILNRGLSKLRRPQCCLRKYRQYVA